MKTRPQVDIPSKLLTQIFMHFCSQEGRGNSCIFPPGKDSSLWPRGTAFKPHHSGEGAAGSTACLNRRSSLRRLSPTSTEAQWGQVFFGPPCPQPSNIRESFLNTVAERKGWDSTSMDVAREEVMRMQLPPPMLRCYSFSKHKLNITLPHNIQIILVTSRDHAWSSKGQGAIRLKI